MSGDLDFEDDVVFTVTDGTLAHGIRQAGDPRIDHQPGFSRVVTPVERTTVCGISRFEQRLYNGAEFGYREIAALPWCPTCWPILAALETL